MVADCHYYGHGMKFIMPLAFQIELEKAEVNIVIDRCWKVLKSEFSEYYAAIFSRKWGPPIFIILCLLTILSYTLLHA